MSINAFLQTGNSVLVAANATAPQGTQITCYANTQVTNTVRLFNRDASNTITYAFGASANEAKNNAVIPVAGGSPSASLPPLAVEVVRVRYAAPNLYVSGITSVAVAANLEVTPGDGL